MAETPSALTVDGAFLGIADGFERFAELSPQDGAFCELKSSEGLPVRFRFDEAFLMAPPPRVELYFANGGVAVRIVRFLRTDQTLRVVGQTRFKNSLLTFTEQGGLVLYLENETGFRPVELPETFAPYEAELAPEGYLLRGRGGFLLLSRTGETLLLEEGRVLGTGRRLRAEVDCHDCLGRTAICEYEGGKLVSRTLRPAREPTAETLALALFESVLLGADCTPYLADSLREKAGLLGEFLGDFTAAVPTGEADRIGLVFPRKERVFDVRYYRAEQKDGRITNILPL